MELLCFKCAILLISEMTVQVSGDMPPPEDELDPKYVATAFAEQYYLLVQKSPEIVHKFYNDESILDHPGPDGEMISAMTMQVSIIES